MAQIEAKNQIKIEHAVKEKDSDKAWKKAEKSALVLENQILEQR